MEENKYYTPSIEEFHVGFEYDYKGTKEWIPQIIMDSEDLGSILLEEANDHEFDISKFRVKYLDKDDIEELGWKYLETNLAGSLFTKQSKKGYWVHLDCTWFSYGCVMKIETSVNKSSKRTLVIHSIRIKNKNEFEKIMQQLNITSTQQ